MMCVTSVTANAVYRWVFSAHRNAAVENAEVTAVIRPGEFDHHLCYFVWLPLCKPTIITHFMDRRWLCFPLCNIHPLFGTLNIDIVNSCSLAVYRHIIFISHLGLVISIPDCNYLLECCTGQVMPSRARTFPQATLQRPSRSRQSGSRYRPAPVHLFPDPVPVPPRRQSYRHHAVTR